MESKYDTTLPHQQIQAQITSKTSIDIQNRMRKETQEAKSGIITHPNHHSKHYSDIQNVISKNKSTIQQIQKDNLLMKMNKLDAPLQDSDQDKMMGTKEAQVNHLGVKWIAGEELTHH